MTQREVSSREFLDSRMTQREVSSREFLDSQGGGQLCRPFFLLVFAAIGRQKAAIKTTLHKSTRG